MVNADWGAFGRSLATLARCLLCGGASQRFGLCDPCREELPYVDHGCAGCALALPEAAAAGLCLGCLRRRPPFDRAFALLHYEYPADRMIGALKFSGRLACGRTLGELMADALRRRIRELPAAIVPVPLHRERQRERGFNQAIELALPIARRLGVELAPGLLSRVRATAPQSGLSARSRRRNVAGGFCLDEARPPESLALVDDVMTTGSTLAAAARACRRGGVRRIEVWVAARAELARSRS